MKSKPSAKPTAAKAGAPYFPQTDAEWEALKAAAPRTHEPTAQELADLAAAIALPGGLTMDERRAMIAAHKERTPRSRERGPQKAPTKQLISLRIATDTLARWRATGPGWQARMDDWLARGPA